MSNLSMVVITDYTWYQTLSRYAACGDVNFWTPTPWNITGLQPGDFVYLLLKVKYGRIICGYGEYKEYKNLDIAAAWEQYGVANGVRSLTEMQERIAEYTNRNSKKGFLKNDHIIGCIILTNVHFFDAEDQHPPLYYGWDISKQVVKYKYVPADHPDRAGQSMPTEHAQDRFHLVSDEKTHHRILAAERKGQNKFRAVILAAYQGKCCITGETTPTILQAAHIQGYRSETSNHVQNGLLLRIDLHSLFDAGLITIDETYVVRVSRHLLSSYYSTLEGKNIFLPDANTRPSIEALRWHNQNVFRR